MLVVKLKQTKSTLVSSYELDPNSAQSDRFYPIDEGQEISDQGLLTKSKHLHFLVEQGSVPGRFGDYMG